MPQEFYTLDEAAERLGVTPDHLLDMAKPGAGGEPPQVRSFMDRGVPRFRMQEIEEVARQRGLGSDMDVPLGAIEGGGEGGPPATREMQAEVFPFELAPESHEPEEDTDIFSGISGAVAPPGADSEVRLIVEGSDLALQPLPGDSKPKLAGSSGSNLGLSGTGKGGREDDSAVPLGREWERAHSDSDINLDAPVPSPKSGKLPPDSGVRLVEDWLVAKEQIAASGLSGLGLTKTPGSKAAPKSTSPANPKSAPPPKSQPAAPKSSPRVAPPPKVPERSDGSSEFELTPLMDNEPSDSVFDPSSAEHSAMKGKQPSTGKQPKPSVEDSDANFELAPEAPDTSKRKKEVKLPPKEPSAEFDLTPLKEASDSSSEFELTLEDEESLSPLEAEKPKAPVKAKTEARDVDLAPLEEEDTGLETSDFELALEEDSSGGEGDTGSEVVVIEEEPVEEADEKPSRRRDVELEEVAAEDDDLVVEAAEGDEIVVGSAMAPPVEWGWWGLVHLPTTLVLLFTGFLLLEMMKSISQGGASGAVFTMISSMMSGK